MFDKNVTIRDSLYSAATVLVFGLAVSATVGLLDLDRQASDERSRVLTELAVVRARVEGVIKATFNSTDGLVHLISLQGGIDQSLFNDMAQLAIGKNPHVRNITLAPNDTVNMVYPLEGNEPVLGLRFETRPDQYRTVKLARERQASLLAGPVDLVQGGRALVQRTPVFTHHGALPGERRYWGAASIVAYVDGLLDQGDRPLGIQVAIRGKDAMGAQGDMVDGDPAVFERQPLTMDVVVPGGSWQLAAVPLTGWTRAGFYASHYFQLGVAISLLVALIMGLRTFHSRQLHERNALLESEMQERRKVEDSLRLYANIFEQTSEAILVTDHQNRIVRINRALEQVTGYRSDELKGRNPSVLASGQTPERVYQDMWSSLNGRGHWQGELWDRRKDGSIYPKWITISAIQNPQGEVTHYLGMFIDITERKSAEERIHHLANHDKLTGLFNRHSLQDHLGQALSSAQRLSAPLAVMFIDMDRFKNINDTLGHHVGDLLLIQVAARLKDSVRQSDIVARLGGDEFVVVLTGMESDADALSVARKIHATLSQPYWIEGSQLYSTPSVGISMFPVDGGSMEGLMKAADTAMYHAKAQGRNNIQFYTAEMNAMAEERMALERDLRSAFHNHQLELHYQPQVSAGSGELCGVEALIRWRHPVRGMVPPLKFIPIAEESELIDTLGDWVLRKACQQIAVWRLQGIRGLRMSVNLSAHQLRSAGLIDQVQAAISAHSIQPGELMLEITESAAMKNPDEAIQILRALRELGVSLAIDDFGTGYSSLAYLNRLPVNCLKIDRSFVKDIETDENDAALCASVLALARSLGLEVVAEGVETHAQREFLVAHGCDELQGYLIAKPEPADRCLASWMHTLQEG